MTGELWTTGQGGTEKAAVALACGGVVGFPTDTVYGLACSPASEAAIARVCEIKGRSASQPLILLAATRADLDEFVSWPEAAVELIDRFWPGPLTLIVEARPPARFLGGQGTVGVRIPAHSVALLLLRQAGPLATTSANRHGEEPAADAISALRLLPGLQGALADPQSRPVPGAPSSILDLTREKPVLIREGRLSARELGVSAPVQGPGIRRD
ncbi:MAG TPA: L-threonylcarbamoyladenylate synthase [Candidatus Dormibacteraeota bacterium]|nr:L-threonylcarbamoyladenylate synthase [Candidatus Dormibacteraeota bacterium]